MNSASWNGKVFGLGEPAANEIIDGGLFAKMAAAKIMSNKAYMSRMQNTQCNSAKNGKKANIYLQMYHLYLVVDVPVGENFWGNAMCQY